MEDRRLLAFETPLLSVPGMNEAQSGGVQPPDTVGDVGRDYYIQAVNGATGALFTIYDKDDGRAAFGPVRMASLATAATPACAAGLGDPIVLYDHAAQRWILTEFADPSVANALCVYVSQTADPTRNTWHAYQFNTQLFPDYPKYGITPEAFIVTTNEQPATPAVYALDRVNMLQGLPARPAQRFSATDLPGFLFEALTPADWDGATPPPGNSPAYVMRHVDDELHGGAPPDPLRDFLEVYEFDVDFANPSRSRFGLVQRVPVNDFDSDLCGGALNCIVQPSGLLGLDGIPQVVMHRLVYRNFGTHEMLLGNFSVDVNGFDRAGIRWFELRKDPNDPNSDWEVFQEGTHQPTAENRWMGSIAMDGAGNIALGYSVSGPTTSPGIRYAGRRASDQPGTMPRGEVNVMNGQGFFLGNRWGDYSAMVVDPFDDSTFWFTTEYANNGTWATQIVSMRFDPEPGPPPPPPPPTVGVSGFKYHDLNDNRRRDQGEPGLPGFKIYIDYDDDGRHDLGEPHVVSRSDGSYFLQIDREGTFFIREEQKPGWVQTEPSNADMAHEVTAAAGAIDQQGNLNFGNKALNDFGDAPSPFPTLLAEGGLVHPITPNFHLGARVDGEGDGIPSALANGDDLDAATNDEDGVVFNALLSPGSTSSVQVTVTSGTRSPGRLNAWFDFNQDRDWDDPGEHVIVDQRFGTGTHTVPVRIPGDARPGLTFARFTYGYRRYQRGESPRGRDTAGEVEDYQVRIVSDTPVAVPDQFEVDQDSVANPLPVLANDIPSNRPPIRVTDVGTPNRGGTALIAPGGTGIRYTPASGFSGTEQFDYTITDDAGNTSTTRVTVQVVLATNVPIAVDDAFNGTLPDGALNGDPFTVEEDSIDNPLPVLANDLSVPGRTIGIVAFTNPSNGVLTIDDLGNGNPQDDVFLYSPDPGFAGTDMFTYTIEDSIGVQDTAEVTIHVQPGALDDDIVEYRLEVSDLNGNPVSAITVGDDFLLRVFVDDLRQADPDPNTPGDQRGVFAAFLDVLYDRQLVSIADVDHGPDFPNLRQGSTRTPGLIDEAGGLQDPIDPTTGPDELLLLVVTLTATGQGTAVFRGDPADDTLDVGGVNDTLTFFPEENVPVEQQRFTDAFLRIRGAGEVPVIVDDTFTFPAGNVQRILDVLDNDTEANNPPLRVTNVTSAANGQVSIGPNGGNLIYIPNQGFTGTDRFTYTAANTQDLAATANVTVQVGQPARAVEFTLEATRLNGTPLNGSSVSPGEQFLLNGFIRDARPNDGDGDNVDERGLFAAYMDLLYESDLVIPVPRQGGFGFEIDFGPDYQNVRSGNANTPNLINEVGAVQSADDQGNILPLGNGKQLLFTITLQAVQSGVADFKTDPADVLPLHDTLTHEPPAPVTIPNIFFGQTTVTIDGAGEGVATNPNTREDVNNDDFVSPIDILLVINHLNGQSQHNAEGEGRRVYFLDVNGDREVTAIDALWVVNYLNRGITAVAEGEGSVWRDRDSTPLANASPGELAEFDLDSDDLLVGAPPVPELIPHREPSRVSSDAGDVEPWTNNSSSGNFDQRVYQKSSSRELLFARWRAHQDDSTKTAELPEDLLKDVDGAWHIGD